MDTSTAKSISIGDIAIKMFLIVTVPVIIGMLFRKFLSSISISFEPLAKKISAVLFVLVLLGAIVAEKDNVVSYFAQA